MSSKCWWLYLLGLAIARMTSAAPYPDRLVWVFGWGLDKESDVGSVNQVLQVAAKSGLNGAVLSANLDTLCKHSAASLDYLKAVRSDAERLGLELIPSVFSVGYGGGALAHNRNLAEGLPVVDAPFVVKNREARLVPPALPGLANGGFEDFKGDHAVGYAFHDMPGIISVADTQTVHSGKASMRLENFSKDTHGHGRVMQKVTVRPHSCYRLSLWVKTEALEPVDGFRVTVLAGDRELAPRTFEVPGTTDWRKLTMLVNSLEFDSVNIYAGVWGGKAGKVWLDDWTLDEVGPLNVLSRPGTPVTVRSEDGRITYSEGKDYGPLLDPEFNFYRIDREAPPLKLGPESRIQEGQRLKVSWYHPMVIHDSQVTVCMAEPELYEIYEHEAQLLAKTLQPKRVLLNMDEVRMGGTCERCRGKDMAALLGQCVTRQAESLRRYSPGLQVYVWSDMLDPHHNARNNYYLVQGDFTGSWNYVPKDLRIAVWGGEPRPKSLEFFSQEGFETLVACYYDAGDLNDVKGWMSASRTLPAVRGFMYTPWMKKYDLLPEFGHLLQSQQTSSP